MTLGRLLYIVDIITGVKTKILHTKKTNRILTKTEANEIVEWALTKYKKKKELLIRSNGSKETLTEGEKKELKPDLHFEQLKKSELG